MIDLNVLFQSTSFQAPFNHIFHDIELIIELISKWLGLYGRQGFGDGETFVNDLLIQENFDYEIATP